MGHWVNTEQACYFLEAEAIRTGGLLKTSMHELQMTASKHGFGKLPVTKLEAYELVLSKLKSKYTSIKSHSVQA